MFLKDSLEKVLGEPVALRAPLKEVKADPFSLESLIAWLENQPAKKRYCFMDTGHCLIAQYFDHCGIKYENIGGTIWWPRLSKSEPLPDGFAEVAGRGAMTFGAALTRAQAALERLS